jgi:hypothetical protein
VFRGATVRTVVICSRRAAGRRSPAGKVSYCPPVELDEFRAIEAGTKPLGDVVSQRQYKVSRRRLVSAGWCLLPSEVADLMDRLREHGTPLGSYTGNRICMGIKSGLTDAFVISAETRSKLLRRNPAASKTIRPFLQGRNVRRYSVEPAGEYLIYTHHGIDMQRFPAVLDHLRPYKERLEGRATQQEWYELQQPQFAYVELMERPKLVFPDIATECRFALDVGGHFGANTVYFIPSDDPALLALLNSRLAQFFFVQTCAALEGPGEQYLRFFGQYLEGFPVCLDVIADRQRERLARLGREITEIAAKRRTAKTGHQQTAIQRQFDAADADIDRVVYEGYGLTQPDVAIVEAATQR